jgi:uncharacterized protein (DUF2141 family)
VTPAKWPITLLTLTAASALVLALWPTPSQGQTSPSGAIVIDVVGLRNNQGKVWVGIFDNRRAFPTKRDRTLVAKWGRISGSQARIRFPALPPGQYAAFAYHDEDGNGDLRTNWIGMPKEGVGASNNAKGRMGPPSFKAASFAVGSGETKLKIRLRYL